MTLNENSNHLNMTAQSYGGTTLSKASKDDRSIHGSPHLAPTLLSEFLRSHQELQSYRYDVTCAFSAGRMTESSVSDMVFPSGLTVRLSVWQVW